MYLLGIDVGTSGCKMLVMRPDGEVVCNVLCEYSVNTPRANWSEQNPDDWYDAICSGLAKMKNEHGFDVGSIDAIAVSGQMVGLVTLDEQMKVIRPCILWNDQRSVEQAQRVTDTLTLNTVLKETGNVIFPTFFAPKILWMKENEPENYARIKHVMFPKDYIVFKLTGELCTDVTDVSGSCVFDVANRKYSDVMIKAFSINESWLPRVCESTDVAGMVSEQAETATGLKQGAIVAAGGGDQACQSIGSGIASPAKCSVTIGTSGVVLVQTDRYLNHKDGIVHVFCHAVKNQWFLMGVMLSAGGSYQWFRNTLRAIKPSLKYSELDSMASDVAIGSNGLVFLPYLTGERCPYNNPNARGVFAGLSASHGIGEMARAVMEGISFGLYDSVNLLKGMGVNIDRIFTSGGASNSPFWLQMLSDIFNIKVVTTNVSEGGALGAAIIAGCSCNAYKDPQEACEIIIKQTSQYLPNPEAHEQYEESYAVYRQLYIDLQKDFEKLAGMES